MRRPLAAGGREEVAKRSRGRSRWVLSHASHWQAVSAGWMRAPSLSHRAQRRVRGGPEKTRIPTSDSHHTSMSESRPASACMRRVLRSATSSGTIAEASQNITRPSRRSSMRTSTADAPALARGGWAAEQGARRPGRTSPSRRSRANLPSFMDQSSGIELAQAPLT